MHKVYIATGKVAHFVDPNAPVLPGTVNERAPSLCNLVPLWPGRWVEIEDDTPPDLPLCRTCEAVMGAISV